MKKIIFAIVIIALSSCTSKVRDAYTTYLDYEYAIETKNTNDSIRLRKEFTNKAILLSSENLSKLSMMIKERESEHKRIARERGVKDRIISNILSTEE